MDKKKYKKTKYTNIYKHIENGTYAVDLSLGYDYRGKRIRTTRTGLKTEKEAKDLIKNLEKQARIKQGIEFDYCFEDFLEEYYNWCLYVDKQDYVNVHKKKGTMNLHILPFFQYRKISDIDDNESLIEEWHKILMEKKNIKNITRRNIHSLLSSYLNWLKIRKKVIKTNPCIYVKNFKADYREIRYYDDKQIGVLKETILNYDKNQMKKWRTCAFLNFAYGNGLRFSEVLGFKFFDFEFDILNSTVCDDDTIVKVHLARTFDNVLKVASDGKTNDSLDIIYVNSITINSILHYVNYCKSIGMVFKEDDYIFKSKTKNIPYSQNTIRNDMNYFIKLANLPHRQIKELRSSTASYLISNGCNLKEVQDQLRHTSSKTTEKHYASLFEKNKIERAKIMKNAL